MKEQSLQDLLNKHHKKINECIDKLINQDELIDYLKNEGIKKEVIEQIQLYILNNDFKMDGGLF